MGSPDFWDNPAKASATSKEVDALKSEVEEYDTLGLGNLMFVFKLPEKYDKIIDIFKEGKYSEFPDWYKNGYFNK